MFCNIIGCRNHFEIECLKEEVWANLGRGTGPKARSLEGEGERAEPEVRTPKQTERDWGRMALLGGESGWSGHGYFASGRGGWKPPFHGYAVSFIKEEVWATIGRGTGPKAKAAEGNDEGGISPVDKPAAQFGSFIHLAELSRKGRGGGGSAGFI